MNLNLLCLNPYLYEVDELEKMEMTKSRPLSKNTWYELYDLLISRIPKSVKKSVSNKVCKTTNQKRLQAPLMIIISNVKVRPTKI